MLKSLPWILIALRVILGPALLAAVSGAAGWAVIPILTGALLSDVFDGIIARRLGVATPALRTVDSLADAAFYLCVAAAVWRACPEVVRAFRVPLLAVVAVEVGALLLDLKLYGRIASFHAYTAKAWGVTLFAAAVALLAFHTGGIWLWLAIIFAFVSAVDALLIRAALPQWQPDVHSFLHARRLRAGASGDCARSVLN